MNFPLPIIDPTDREKSSYHFDMLTFALSFNESVIVAIILSDSQKSTKMLMAFSIVWPFESSRSIAFSLKVALVSSTLDDKIALPRISHRRLFGHGSITDNIEPSLKHDNHRAH